MMEIENNRRPAREIFALAEEHLFDLHDAPTRNEALDSAKKSLSLLFEFVEAVWKNMRKPSTG